MQMASLAAACSMACRTASETSGITAMSVAESPGAFIERFRGECPVDFGRCQDDLPTDGQQDLEDLAIGFVGEDPDDQGQVSGAELFPEIGGQVSGGSQIVGAVDDDKRRCRHNLQPPRPPVPGKSRADGIYRDPAPFRLRSSQPATTMAALSSWYFPARPVRMSCHVLFDADVGESAATGRLRMEIRIQPVDRRILFGGRLLYGGPGILLADAGHHGNPGFDDACFLRGDLREGVS